LAASLRPELDAILADAYGDALLKARRETGLAESTFPPTCPWTFDQASETTPKSYMSVARAFKSPIIGDFAALTIDATAS
jgi:Domain of unknown function DUF29